VPISFFATDLHGQTERYDKLLAAIVEERPAGLFLGGDLLPKGAASRHGIGSGNAEFIEDRLIPGFARLRGAMGSDYPQVFVILGNDDPRCEEPYFLDAETRGLWSYIHQRRLSYAGFDLFGYACVPPTPFLLKDWERYDVSRHVDPGSVSPEEGHRTVPVSADEIRFGTIQKDLAALAGDAALDRAIFLFHTPPYDTPLDRAALDGRAVDHVPMDVHVGSIAVRRFIEERRPCVTLHGHVHESARLTGTWKTRIGATVCINGAHDGPELSLVRFDPEDPEAATRRLL
jgi:Icc-related predicted phosphoesterase